MKEQELEGGDVVASEDYRRMENPFSGRAFLSIQWVTLCDPTRLVLDGGTNVP